MTEEQKAVLLELYALAVEYRSLIWRMLQTPGLPENTVEHNQIVLDRIDLVIDRAKGVLE